MAAKAKSTQYPATTWNESLSFARKLDSVGVRRIATEEAARIYGLKNIQTKSFQYRVSAARQYGLVAVQSGTISLTDTAIGIIHPTVENTRALEQACFANPPLHKKLLQAYDGKPIPRIDLFENILVKEYGIAEGAKQTAARCFIQSAESLGLIEGGILAYTSILERANSIADEQGLAGAQESTKYDVPTLSRDNLPRVSTSDDDVIYQRIPLRSGGAFEISVPLSITKGELGHIKKLIDLLLEGAGNMDEP